MLGCPSKHSASVREQPDHRTSVTGGANPLAVHDPGKIVTDLAVAVALGGDAACDIAELRAQPGCSARWSQIRRCLG